MPQRFSEVFIFLIVLTLASTVLTPSFINKKPKNFRLFLKINI